VDLIVEKQTFARTSSIELQWGLTLQGVSSAVRIDMAAGGDGEREAVEAEECSSADRELA
jgi:hypothetical protein